MSNFVPESIDRMAEFIPATTVALNANATVTTELMGRGVRIFVEFDHPGSGKRWQGRYVMCRRVDGDVYEIAPDDWRLRSGWEVRLKDGSGDFRALGRDQYKAILTILTDALLSVQSALLAWANHPRRKAAANVIYGSGRLDDVRSQLRSVAAQMDQLAARQLELQNERDNYLTAVHLAMAEYERSAGIIVEMAGVAS